MPASQQAIALAQRAAQAAAQVNDEHITILDVSDQQILSEIFVIVAADNERQVSAIVDKVDEAMHKAGVRRERIEGQSGSRWILVDYGEFVLHAQHSEEHEFYALEKLWRDCPVIEWERLKVAAAASPETPDAMGN